MKTLRKRVIGAGAGVLLGVLLVGNIAFASTQWKGYDTKVGKFNGNGYTGYQEKETDGANGKLESELVGGNYKVDARMIDEGGESGVWLRNVDDNHTYSLPGYHKQYAGEKVRVQFSNDITTCVDVRVTGQFMCDN